ncbi:MAG TPA: AAA family ATPase [Gemmatimonadota bacterium]|nr:AAA family ATPase [Gemmatimonadota bacterium]
MESQAISSAVISIDPQFRAVFQANGDGGEVPIQVTFEILVPFVEISHGHLEELRYVDADIIFLDLEHDPQLGCKLAQFLVEANPSQRLIAAGTEHSPEFLMTVMQAGISEYLPKPVSREALTAAIGRTSRKLGAKQPSTAAGPAHREPGRLLAFFSAKGGSGSTTVATNLAIHIHRLTGKRTVLVDLDLELGEIALFMGMEPRFNFVDLAKNFHRMDAGLLASFIECHDSGVHLLSAPYHPEKAEAVTGDQTRQILQFLKQHYEYVVVDTSNSFTARTLAALDLASEVYLVANIDLPSLRNIQRCQHLLERMGHKGQVLRLIVNRYASDNDITLEDVERSLNQEIYWALPNDYESVIYSINTGRPVILDDSSRYTHELQALAAKMTGLPGAVARRKGWFSRTIVDPLKSFLGNETRTDEPLMLPPAVVGGERA